MKSNTITVLIGEVGLFGEIRPAHNASGCIKEAKRLGYQPR